LQLIFPERQAKARLPFRLTDRSDLQIGAFKGKTSPPQRDEAERKGCKDRSGGTTDSFWIGTACATVACKPMVSAMVFDTPQLFSRHQAPKNGAWKHL
jgi:hypothetical protein